MKDLRTRIAIARRIERLEVGNLGRAKAVGGGVSELIIDTGPGYRVYYVIRERIVVILLVGGDKSTQSDDIKEARKLAKEI
jgi:putative addiction module killer protein